VPFRDYLRFQQQLALPKQEPSKSLEARRVSPAIDFARLRAEAVAGENGEMILGERPSMRLLREFGIDCPQIHYARSSQDIEQIAATIQYPCVMKISEPVIAHKTDLGGVVLNIISREALLSAWNDMGSRLAAREVMVVEQIESGMEVLVGCVRDQTFGMRLTVGSGGIWTNMVNDSVTLIPPFNTEYIRSVLPKLAIWAPMNGARGQPKLAVDKLIDTIARIASLGGALRHELREFECNPVMVTPTRAVAADAVGFF
jgi:acetyltransferase